MSTTDEDGWERPPAKASDDGWERPPVKNVAPKKAEPAKLPTTAGDYARTIGKGALGLVDAAATVGSGAVTGIVAPLAGAGRAAYGMLSGEGFEPSMLAGQGVNERVQEAGTWKPRTEEGQAVTGAIGSAIESGKEKLGSLTDNPAGSAALAAAPDAVLGAVGIRGLRNARGIVTPPKQLNQMDTAIAEAQRAGFMANPASSNPSAVNRTLESIAGSPGIKSNIAEKNVARANVLVKEELGLKPDDFLNETALLQIRQKAGQVYEKIKNLNMQIPANEPRFQQAIRDIDKQFESVREFTPGLIDLRDMQRVQGLVANPQNPNMPGMWTPKALLEISQQLRAEATKVLDTAQSNKAAYKEASAMKAAATAMEDLIENALTPQGVQRVATGFNLVSDFRKARQTIAKTYDVEGATNLVTGQVDPEKLARSIQSGDRLTGNLEVIGRAASAMPEVMRVPGGSLTKSDAAMYMTDLGVAAAATALSHGIAAPYAAGIVARPAIRSMMSSQGYQNKMGKVFNKPGRQYSMRGAGQALGAEATMATQPPEQTEEIPLN